MSQNHLDDRDLKILDLLEINARMPVSELAREVNLSPTAIRQRLAKLERNGDIAAYTIRRAKQQEKTGLRVLMLLRLTGSFCKQLKAEFGHVPEIKKFWSTAGELDSSLILEVSDVGRLTEITNMFSDHELVTKVQTHLITETHIDR
ncbi:Lrp/AsnC family transcriptional regulator [Curvivirga sp.]|uniref:Lrp/AsnC family transcriptional regulator n=1 Tax=Curvivirga sp. TaxID=2856848 RepID=UPI003B5A5B08